MKCLRKALILPLFAGFLFALHGKIVFFDGTYVVGKVTKVDESTVYIVPMGLDTPEGVLVGNIDSLRMENGMVPVINSAVKYFYQNGEFLANDDDWMDEYDDFKYDDYTTLQEEYQYEESKKTHLQYYSVTAYGGLPIPMASLKDSLDQLKMDFNLGAGFQSPYFQLGAVDISPGLKLMTYGFTSPLLGEVTAIQAAGNMSVDFKPILYFLPEALHLCLDLGINYNTPIKNEIGGEAAISKHYDGEPTYGGMGFNLGGSMDYYFPNLPMALKLFMQTNVIPQPEPYPELKTGFLSIGATIVIVLKRHR